MNGFRVAQPRPHRESSKLPEPHLTGRQLEVLTLLCRGLSNKLICRELDISPGTVKVHISTILRQLGVASRLQAVVVAHSMELVQKGDTAVPEVALPPLSAPAHLPKRSIQGSASELGAR